MLGTMAAQVIMSGIRESGFHRPHVDVEFHAEESDDKCGGKTGIQCGFDIQNPVEEYEHGGSGKGCDGVDFFPEDVGDLRGKDIPQDTAPGSGQNGQGDDDKGHVQVVNQGDASPDGREGTETYGIQYLKNLAEMNHFLIKNNDKSR